MLAIVAGSVITVAGVGFSITSVLVLRTVRGGEDGAFVPHASVSVAVLLAMASVGALVYFIDHVSLTLQAPQLVAAVSRDLDAAIRRVLPAPHPARRRAARSPTSLWWSLHSCAPRPRAASTTTSSGRCRGRFSWAPTPPTSATPRLNGALHALERLPTKADARRVIDHEGEPPQHDEAQGDKVHWSPAPKAPFNLFR